jgi:hypothetical protein
MKRLVMISAFASASVVSGFAQDATAPKTPVIVGRLVLKKQTPVERFSGTSGSLDEDIRAVKPL